MNLRDLKYLVAVAETGHFGQAAKRCYVSQPTLSSQIKKLEEQLGVTIFERTNRSVRVTPVGEEIIAHARQSIEQADAIEQLAKAYQAPMAGPLRIGAIPTLSPYLTPLILGPLQHRYPELKLILFEEPTAALENRLKDHELDAALLATPASKEGLQELPLFNEPFWLIHPPSHPLYTKEEITGADLRGLDVLLLSEMHCLSSQVMEVCGVNERRQGIIETLGAFTLETLVQLVAAGHGCTLVPALAVHGGWITASGVIARKLEVPGAYRSVRLVFRQSFPQSQTLSALAEVIWDYLPNTVQRISTGSG
jgi:LysR family hydrogen peroxide-inducible transcriptional activator